MGGGAPEDKFASACGTVVDDRYESRVVQMSDWIVHVEFVRYSRVWLSSCTFRTKAFCIRMIALRPPLEWARSFGCRRESTTAPECWGEAEAVPTHALLKCESVLASSSSARVDPFTSHRARGDRQETLRHCSVLLIGSQNKVYSVALV